MSKEFTLKQTTINNFLTKYDFLIPDFQRKFVWKKLKQQQLIDSLLKGFPMGAITLYDNIDDDNYLIIDGLQRINTLNLYLKSPSKIINFNEYFKSIDNEYNDFVKSYNFSNKIESEIKLIVKNWYVNLNSFMEFKKVFSLYNEFENIELKVDDLATFTEILHEILKKPIDITDREIAIIIYHGDKDNLPELFKNINTGSVALTQYEIFQSIWINYKLDEQIFSAINSSYKKEMDIVQEDYEVDSKVEINDFDIFKNFVGLNYEISNIKQCDVVFKYLKKTNKKGKIYENDSIAFEIFSTIVEGTSNKVNKAVKNVFKHEQSQINNFVYEFNNATIDSIKKSITYLNDLNGKEINNSKYHSLYIVVGVMLANYFIDLDRLTILEKNLDKKIIHKVLDIDTQINESWFINENRQIGFFTEKIKELKN